jgi:dihydroflavonol-4-reductase
MPMSQLTIVTRGAGFIGGHLVERLARSGQTVRVIERPGTDVGYLPAEVEVVFVDIRDRDALASALKGGRWVYHLAANPNLWARDRNEFEAVNHIGTVNVLGAAIEAGAERILHTSTESILTKEGATELINEI